MTGAIIEANINLGETLLTQNKIRDAKPIYEQALEISKQKDDRDKCVFDVYYSRYLWETGKNDEAIELLKNAVNFLESSEIFYEMQARAFLANYFYLSGRIKEAEQQLIKFKNRFRGAFGSGLESGDDFDSDFETVFPDFGWIWEDSVVFWGGLLDDIQ